MIFEKIKPVNSVWNKIKNATIYRNKYKNHSEGVIVACYFNPQNSPYRTKAFNTFYNSIKHLNHRVVECVIGDSKPELSGKYISHVYTKDLLWHKEALLNKVIAELPEEYKYVFWVDADVLFTNKNWFVDGVESMGKYYNIIQPFEYCIHLDKDEIKPSFDYNSEKGNVYNIEFRNKKMWRSFAANAATGYGFLAKHENYDLHGHVGFAWAARREILEQMPLYDKALIGGADHIIAHASAAHINHKCIQKSFTDTIDEINEWSIKFSELINSRIGFVRGELFHIWHGDIEKRQYLKRVQEFTPKTKEITEKDENGLYVHNDIEAKEYMESYFSHREVTLKKPKKFIDKQKSIIKNKDTDLRRTYPDADDSFINSLLISYFTENELLGYALGGDILGAMIGEALSDSDNYVEFGGGEFGGSGSGGSWDNNQNDSTNHNLIFTESNDVENFS